MTSGVGLSLGADDPRQVGPYHLRAALGQGDTGSVYLGRTRGGRAVAVKVISPQLAGDEGFRRRLTEELAAVGRATGTGLLETVAADAAADPPWLASPYIPGVSLAEAVRIHGPLPLGTVRVLGAGLAEALIALHAAGLVHAALQPHKVLLAADGPRLTAFAAARAVAAAVPSRPATTADGRFLAPEQARGHHVGPESDVFALAGLLVFAASGRPPFRDGAGADVLRSIVEDPPELGGVPEHLHEPLAGALEKVPEHRPSLENLLRQLAPTAQETAAWLPPPLAAPAAAPAAPRRRALLLAVGGAGAFAAAGGAAGVLLTGSADSTDGQDVSRRPSGGEPAPAATGLIPTHTIELGSAEHGTRVAYSPDGGQLAITLEDRVTLWDADSHRRLADLTAEDILFTTSLAYGASGLLALGYTRTFTLENFATDLGGITAWNTGGRQPQRVAQLESPTEDKALQGMEAVALSPDGLLVAGARNAQDAIGKVQVWEVRSGRLEAELLIGAGRGNTTSAARSLAFSPDGRLLAAGWGVAVEGGVSLFRTDSWEPDGELPLNDTNAFGVTSLAFTPDGRTLAGSFGGLALWDVPGRSLTDRIGTANDGSQTIAVSPDGRTVAVGGAEVSLYDLDTRQRRVTVLNGASDLAFRPDGRTLAGSVITSQMLAAVQLWTVE
ncbi:protein kinase domain-containing protein [Streptomyces sp. 4N509B]